MIIEGHTPQDVVKEIVAQYDFQIKYIVSSYLLMLITHNLD